MTGTRKHKRYKVDDLKISGNVLLAKYMKILDISIGGMALLTEKRMSIGRQYTFKIEGKGRSLTAQGVVVWSLLSESIGDTLGNVIPLYKVGMKFADLSTAKTCEIADFIESHKHEADRHVDVFSASGRRLHIRIQIEEPERAVLNVPEGYKVKSLSLSGMLIESEHTLQTESTLPMEITLPDNKCIQFLGRVVSCLEIEEAGVRHNEIEIDFAEISKEDRERLHNFTRTLKKTGKHSPPS
jgi:c-di-GMP-binding flagellar brake protein YcgR